MFNITSKKSTFTLAEVLITLGIIGVVAALTIPNLITNANSRKYSSQLRKTISTLNQAVRMSIAQNDMDFASVKVRCTNTPANDTLDKDGTLCGLFNSTLKGATYVNNISSLGYSDNIFPYDIDIDEFYSSNDVYAYQLADGSVLIMQKPEIDCHEDDPCYNFQACTTKEIYIGKSEEGDFYVKSPQCIGFIDVNGSSPPNKLIGTEKRITDIYPIVVHDQTAKINPYYQTITKAAQYVLDNPGANVIPENYVYQKPVYDDDDEP